MPLPSNGPLSLLGSGTGADPSGKHAMIVRMSAETLEALEDFPDHPQMDFEFGDSPGIHIGETFFPMRPLKGTSPHELYLRLPSATKPMAPLRLHASVIGKFTVERELGEKVTDKVRDSTLVAEKQRTERKAIMLDTPPTLPATNGKKRKVPQASSTMFRNPIKTGNDRPTKVASSSVPPSTRVTVPPPTEEISGPRMRLIHCLAISPRFSDDVLRLVGGANATATYRQELLAILHEVGEQVDPVKKGADKSNRPWRLKTKSWLEVRPYEWSKLNETERTAVARQARLAFNDMKIPESDPAWGHVRYRNGSNASNSNGNGAGTSKNASTPKVETAAKRGISSQDDSQKKSKSRTEGTKKQEIVQMKDESVKAGRISSDIKSREGEERDLKASESAAGTKPVARRPGSGYKPSLSTHDSRSGSADSNRIPRMSSTAGSTDSRTTQRKDAPSPSLPPKPAPEVLANQERERKPSASGSALRMVKQGRDSIGGRGTDSDWERSGEGRIPKKRMESEPAGKRIVDPDREAGGTTMRIKKVKDSVGGGIDSDRERDRVGPKSSGKERDHHKGWERDGDMRDRERNVGGTKDKDREYDKDVRDRQQRDRDRNRDWDRAPSVGTKRKKTTQEQEELSYDSPPKVNFQKKRKTAEGAVPVPSAAPSSKPRDLSLPKKPEMALLPPHSLVKKEAPPVPPLRPLSRKTPVEASSTSSRTSKGNGMAKSRRRSPIYTSSEDDADTTRMPLKREQISVSLPPASSPAPPLAVAPQAASHRSRLSVSDHATLRARYRSSWQDYIAIVAKVAAEKTKIETLLDSNSVDSDGDVDLLDVEELEKLSARHMALRDELESIRKAFEGGGSGSD